MYGVNSYVVQQNSLISPLSLSLRWLIDHRLLINDRDLIAERWFFSISSVVLPMTSSTSTHKLPHLIKSHHLALRGHALLGSPRFNKGTAFPLSERTTFGLEGRLPYRTNTLDEQCERAYEQLMQRDTPIRKNTFLQSLKEQNWTLYYALLTRHLKELVPVIYTPTEVSDCFLFFLYSLILLALFYFFFSGGGYFKLFTPVSKEWGTLSHFSGSG